MIRNVVFNKAVLMFESTEHLVIGSLGVEASKMTKVPSRHAGCAPK